MIHAAAGSYGQGGFFCRDINDCRLMRENERQLRLCGNLPPTAQKGNNMDRKLLERILKKCVKDGEYSSSQLMASGKGMGSGR